MTRNKTDDFQIQLDLEEREKRLAESATTDDPYTYKDTDGTVYEWNHDKNAWFPKIDESFIAAYQSNYTYTEAQDATDKTEADKFTTASTAESNQTQYQSLKRLAPETQGWFDVDDTHNTNVYVSNLPLDITEDEFVELMSKCGLIMKDPLTNKLKLKLYEDATGKLKGDGRCCYIKVESVELALKILDGSSLRNKEIHIERAKFQMKGQYDPTKKPKKMKSKEKKKVKELQEK